VLTFQGHAEFDRFINSETVKVFGKPIWEESFITNALKLVDKDDDALWAARVMLKFFLEGENEQSRSDIIEGTVRDEEKIMARL